MAPLSFVLSLVTHAITVTPPTVAANDRQETVLSLDTPSVVRVWVKDSVGTSCALVDRVRGPFLESPADKGCDLTALLDAGQYKLRLTFPPKGKGLVAVNAQPFTELNAKPIRLAPKSSATFQLKPQEQATYWLSLPTRQPPYVRVAGRNVGAVRLWRQGAWLELGGARETIITPSVAGPVHEWWLDEPLEAGEYALVLSGENPVKVATDRADDTVTVSVDFPLAPAEGLVPFTLPAGGAMLLEVPGGAALTAVVGLSAGATSAVELLSFGFDGSSRLGSPASCRIEPNALVPECIVQHAGTPARRVLLVRGPEGTRGTVDWANSDEAISGTGSTRSLAFKGDTTGKALVGAIETPLDSDGPPAGCELQAVDSAGTLQGVLARHATTLLANEELSIDFNYAGTGTAIWFTVTQGGTYTLQTAGTSKARCEVALLNRDGTQKRLTQTKPQATKCTEKLNLSPGTYAVTLYEGLSGVEHVTVRPEGSVRGAAIPARGCLLPLVEMVQNQSYQLVFANESSARVRTLVHESLPLRPAKPLRLLIEGQQTWSAPISSNTPVQVLGGVSCQLGKNSTCQLAANVIDTLTLRNADTTPRRVTLARPGQMPVVARPATFAPAVSTLPTLAVNTSSAFTFDRGESHSVIFQVAVAGMYQATTTGLLATSCRMRTATVPDLARDTSGGRGRNCLLQQMLQPGRYLFTAATEGQSLGRAGMVLTRRPPVEGPPLTNDGEVFYKADRDAVLQQRLTVKTTGTYDLRTSIQGSSALCRLDDSAGWPLEKVPMSCSIQRELQAGTYLWTQLPLTVESMRNTVLRKTVTPTSLKGNRPHQLQFFTWYTAELGADGKDEFLFSLSGETPVEVVLTGGMQGRLFLLEEGKPPKAIEVIPPGEATANPPNDDSNEGGAEEEIPRRRFEEESNCDEGDCPEPAEEAAPAVEPMAITEAPPPPRGTTVTLAAGTYKLLAEHSRGDVGIEYQLHFGASTLLPGMTRSLPVPTRVPVFLPRDGTLRLRTSGEADVRCRLFNEAGAVVLDSSDNGSDWNCSAAEPLLKGRYSLVVESETQTPGDTTVALQLPTVEDVGVASDGRTIALSGPVVSATVPASAGVVELVANGKSPFSCALLDDAGAVMGQQRRVTQCGFMVRPGQRTYRWRLWTTDGLASVVLEVKDKSVSVNAAEVPAGRVAQRQIARAGRFTTAKGVHCLMGEPPGLLQSCGPEASLETGLVTFAAFGPNAQPLPLSEVRQAATPVSIAVNLSRRHFIQTLTSAQPSIFTLAASVGHGERAAPACQFDGVGTVREGTATSCHAASAQGIEATGRLWAATEGLSTQVVREAFLVPPPTSALQLGHRRLTTTAGTSLWKLPASLTRIDLVVPPRTWAFILNAAGHTVNLCAPQATLSRCLVVSQGGSLMLAGPAGEVDATATVLEMAPKSIQFSSLYEDVARAAGSVRLVIQPSNEPRAYLVERAVGCTLVLPDGQRQSDCTGTVPANTSAELVLQHDAGPLRALVFASNRERWARMGLELSVTPGPSLAESVVAPLQPGRTDRTVVLDREAVVHLSATQGVCGLFRGNELLTVEGLDSGCDVVRTLPKGTYRFVVRPFSNLPMSGSLRWEAEPAVGLQEGVGAEVWLAPGAVRLFKFSTQALGKVGLGLQSSSERLECTLLDEGNRQLGRGCHQYLALSKGHYLLTVRNPPTADAQPLAVKPVVLGLTCDTAQVPAEYLQDFFRRIGP